MIVIDKLCYHSGLRYVNPCEKFVFSIFTLLVCVISRSFAAALTVLLVNGILTVCYGRIPVRRYVRLMTVPFVFLLVSTIAVIVNISGVPMDAYAVPVGDYYITGSYVSLVFGSQLILTALASVSCLYFLSLHTPVTDIVGVLSKLHCPLILVELMLLIYRFIFLLWEAADGITTAQNSRLGNKDFRTSLYSFGKMCSVLLVGAFKKSNALYDAMESRCYDGRIRVLDESLPPKRKEIIGIIAYEGLLIGIALWENLV